MSAGFKSIEIAKKMFGLSGENQKALQDILLWADQDDRGKKYIRLYTKGEITREQLIEACRDITKNQHD